MKTPLLLSKAQEDRPTKEAFLTEQELATQLRMSPVTLRRWRREGGGPRFVVIGDCVRYRQSDVDAFIGESVENTLQAKRRRVAQRTPSAA